MSHDSRRREFLKLGTAIGTGLVMGRASALAAAPQEPPPTEMSAFDAIRGRRSVRKFKPTPIPREHLERILQAARLAPTSGNQQPWKFLVVDDRALIDRLGAECVAHRLAGYREREEPTAEALAAQRELLERHYADYLSAPVYVVILTSSRSRYPEYNHWDGPLAAANLMLAARALGYGTVFCTDTIPEEVTRRVFRIPDHLTRVCITPIGVPDAWPPSPGKMPWRSFVVRNSF